MVSRRRNGDQAERLEKKQEAQKEQLDRKLEQQEHLNNLKFNDEGQISQQFLESVADTSDLQGQTLNLLQNYITKTWIFSNLKESEVHDIRWKIKGMKLKIRGHYPPRKSCVTGDVRAFVLDDPDQNVTPLSDQELATMDTILDTIEMAIIPRAREGFERKQLNTRVRESRTRRTEEGENESRRRFGLF